MEDYEKGGILTPLEVFRTLKRANEHKKKLKAKYGGVCKYTVHQFEVTE